MSNLDIIRAWKDAQYRQSLSADELASLPAHPAGNIELSDSELAGIAGGTQTTTVLPTVAGPCQFTLEAALCANTVLAAGACPHTLGIGTAPCFHTAGVPICPVIG